MAVVATDILARNPGALRPIPPSWQQLGEQMGGVWVILQAWEIGNLWCAALLGPEGARITEGYGIWETVAIPRGVAGLTEWKGRRNYHQSIDLLFDGWYQYPLRPNLPNFFWYRPYTEPRRPYAFSENRPAWVESEVRALELLAVRTEWQGMTTPPPVRLYGAIRHGEKKWVIENIEWGDSIMDVTTGRLLRQQATVHLIEHYQPGALAKLPRGRAG